MIHELDVVVLTHDVPEYGLEAGDIGTVVHCHTKSRAIEVEFVTGEGEPVAIVTLAHKDIRAMQGKEILHARSLKAA